VSTPRRATALQGWVLVSCGWLAVMASAMLSPVLPSMTAYFRAVRSVDLQVSLVAALPALLVALLAWPFGILGDRIGHKRVLCSAAAFYGVVGTAPLWLPGLPEIVASRALVGVAEAAIMTCSTTLLGAYFEGARRARYLALQTGTAPIAAVTVIAIGGALGETSWRAPFLAYGFGFVLAPLTGLLLWEVRAARGGAGEARGAIEAVGQASVGWGRLIWICVVTLFTMTAFLVTVVQTGFLLTERGVRSPQQIGMWQGLASLANPLGALLFGLLRWHTFSKLTLAYALLSTGFFVIAALGDWRSAVLGAAVANLGAGMILPTLITWAIGTLPHRMRGNGTGLWMAASFLGQFLSPLVVLGLRTVTGSLSKAILVYAVACGLCGLAALGARLRLTRHGAPPPNSTR
jgi:MFS family permease